MAAPEQKSLELGKPWIPCHPIGHGQQNGQSAPCADARVTYETRVLVAVAVAALHARASSRTMSPSCHCPQPHVTPSDV